MNAEPKQSILVECKTAEDRVLASIEIAPIKEVSSSSDSDHPLVLLSVEEARKNGEERIQLRERGRYKYRLKPAGKNDKLMLLESRGITRINFDNENNECGIIETKDQCGLFPLTVIRNDDPRQLPLARAGVEVRSIKMGGREHYRDMLSFIADKCAGLLLDCRAPTRLRLDSLWKNNTRIIEQQLEFLRYMLESQKFRTAIDEILRNPHRRLEDEFIIKDISQPFRSGKVFSSQIAMATRRVNVPETHPLNDIVKSLPAKVSVKSRADFLNTAENRFAKMVLADFRDFLVAVASQLSRNTNDKNKPSTLRMLQETRRLRGMLETQLTRGFFPDVTMPTILPLGSPVLQRKGGYRDLLKFWLEFHAGAQLAWDGGTEVFHAGARNVATLYEYWLFFQLEELFRQRFSCEQPLHSIIVDKKRSPPTLVLKRGIELRTPVSGIWSIKTGRQLKAEFHFNRKFTPCTEQDKVGSWTRGVQPDYTISIWPAKYSKQEAEQNELMVHVHFDAKYRVERLREILGDGSDDDDFKKENGNKDKASSAAKYADLLKMHAYRDAIRRTAGAYVIYPGEPGDGQKYQGFHEVLPGLGAFAIRPGKDGKPEGMSDLAGFLDNVIEHLANRTTARERVTYHLSEAYMSKEEPVSYGSLKLAETDVFGESYRALPPSEHYVLVSWYRDAKQLEWTAKNCIAIVRLGKRPGAWHIQPEFSEARHILLHTRNGISPPGLWKLRTPGYKVYTDNELKSTGYPGLAAGEIYAVFDVEPDPEWAEVQWHDKKLIRAIRDFENRIKHRLAKNIGRRSAYPQIIPLRDLLKAKS